MSSPLHPLHPLTPDELRRTAEVARTAEGAAAIRSLLEDDWDFPIVDGDLDPVIDALTDADMQARLAAS